MPRGGMDRCEYTVTWSSYRISEAFLSESNVGRDVGLGKYLHDGVVPRYYPGSLACSTIITFDSSQLVPDTLLK
jgi:hypothetical protein